MGGGANRTAVTFGLITLAFLAVAAYTLVLPPIRAAQERQRFTVAAQEALPAGTVRTTSGVSGRGSYTGVASGHLARSPAAVLANPEVAPGAYGWSPIPNCGTGLLCFLSQGKNFLLTLTIKACAERGCPAGGTLVDAEVTRGGPNS